MKTVGIVLLSLFGIAVIAAIALTLYVRRNPFEVFAWSTRRQLSKTLARQTTPGGVVYFAGGSGPKTMVLVHGVNDQAGSWSTVAEDLATKFRVVAIDLPGHGESAPKSGVLPMRKAIDALGEVIERESPGAPVILVGNSMGGWVSMLYAAEHPARVAHLVLEDASGMAWDVSKVPVFPKNREESVRLLRMVQGPQAKIPLYVADEMIRLAPALPQKRVLDSGIVAWLVDARLPQLTMPVTLIWGAHDGLLPLAYANALRAKLPNAKLEVIGDAAHIPHRQTPAAFLRILLGAVA